MKRMVKIVIKCAAFLFGLAIILFVASKFFMPKNNLKEFGMEDVNANGILGETENTIDVLILGDSEAYSSITPMRIWEKYGITSYVCATSGQHIYQANTFLRNGFKRQKPKVVILDTDTIYREISRNNAIVSATENVFPVFKYHNRWKSMKTGDIFQNAEYTWTDDCKGYIHSVAVEGATDLKSVEYTDKTEKISVVNEKYLLSMVEFCRKNDTQFLMVSTPSIKNWSYERHNGLKEFADKYNVTFIDLNVGDTYVNIDWTTDTRDKGDHLNYYGAVKVTDYLGKYLNDNYEFEDHRSDNKYSKWNESLTRYNSIVNN